MPKVKYHASASFDIETEVEVDATDEAAVRAAILDDLEARYGAIIEVINITNK